MKNKNMVIRMRVKKKPTYQGLTLKMIEDYLMEAFYGRQEIKERRIHIWPTGNSEAHTKLLNKAMQEEMARLKPTNKQD